MNMFPHLVVLCCVVLVHTSSYDTSSKSLDTSTPCTRTEDCSENDCCALGMERFSVPRCTPYPREGQVCRPYNNRSFDSTLYDSINKKTRQFYNIYSLLCPCFEGLECSGGNACVMA